MKPLHSYKNLIRMCLLNSPLRRATLLEIYTYISSNFSFYSTRNKRWKNGIRHTLSFNRTFERTTYFINGAYVNYWIISDKENNASNQQTQHNQHIKMQIPRNQSTYKRPTKKGNPRNSKQKIILPRMESSSPVKHISPQLVLDPWISSSFNSMSGIKGGISSPILLDSSESLWSPVMMKVDYLSYFKSPKRNF